MAGGEERSETLARLPRLGFGGAAVGNLYAPLSDAAARGVIEAALVAGIGYFDTAPHYGFGLSETRLGEALAGRDAMVSTKVGRRLEPVATSARERHGFVDAAPFEPVFDYTRDGVMRSFEDSLRRLRRDRVDVLLAHDLGQATHGEAHVRHMRDFLEGGYRAMRELRDAGVVGAIGLGVNEQAVCEEILDHADVDVFLLAGRYTLLEQTALESFLPRCAARNVGIVIGGPFNSGALVETGGTLHYNYEAAPTAIVERVARLRRVCAAHDVPLAAAALRFPLAHPAVLSVIPGMATLDQVADAMRWLSLAIPDALWSDLKSEGLVRADAPVPVTRAAA
ncbi:aldo/keto reductase [Caulobacter sp. RL271]|uniref:Aldo/keto reductase n=1 Tax=Caulobacter segnis TaxID=88688 RepID=A0ABY4ZZT7_9CAUL|nr:aldo/keto reductase [Caulobacter segnis]USQ98327.1 aldo/keto reductase [Caulobacter segnis]